MQKYLFPLMCTVCTLLQPLAFPESGWAQSPPDSEPAQISSQESDSGADPDSDDDTYDLFYDRLASDGQWLYDDDYGYVFQPAAASTSSWRPYSDGHWVWTDRGWTWVSNESFGWATYHYGRWIRVSGAGWVWIPGNEWAPAWVSWRQTDDDDSCGWAPLPPEATVSVNVGVSSWADNYYDIGPAAFTFVRYHDFWRHSYRGYYLPQNQNLTIINRSRNITNITYNNNVINNYGPQFQHVSRITGAQGHPLQTYQVNYSAQARRNAAYKTSVHGNQISIIAPPQRLNAVARTQPQAARQLGKSEVQRGWQNLRPAQKQQLQQTFAKQAPVPATLPPKPGAPAKPQFIAGKPPGTPGTKPIIQPTKPANQVPLVTPATKPFIQAGKPANQPVPPVNQPPPVTPATKPVIQAAKPANQPVPPVNQAPPVIPATKPFIQAAKPANQAAPPMNQPPPVTPATKPVIQAAKPANQPVPPVKQAPPVTLATRPAKVANQATKPVVQPAKPGPSKTQQAHVVSKARTPQATAPKSSANAQNANRAPAKHETAVQHRPAPVKQPPPHQAAPRQPVPVHTAPARTAPAHAAQPHPAAAKRPAPQPVNKSNGNPKEKDKKKG